MAQFGNEHAPAGLLETACFKKKKILFAFHWYFVQLPPYRCLFL